MNHPYYLCDTKGNLRFTSQGLSELGPYLAMAGIDIRTITTKDGYIKARQLASPYFMDWLKRRAENWPDTDQFNLLRQALISGEDSKAR